MNTIVEYVVNRVAEQYGLSVVVTYSEDSEDVVVVKPSEGHQNESFSVTLKIGWRSHTICFEPGAYAAPLIWRMGSNLHDNVAVINLFRRTLEKYRYVLEVGINGQEVVAEEPYNWPQEWRRLTIRAIGPLMVLDAHDTVQVIDIVDKAVLPFLGIVFTLVGIEDFETSGFSGVAEGTPYETMSTRYERKQLNRTACIALKGACCHACGFNFEDAYGDIGRGYIEVHHIVPVSRLGSGYILNIDDDLVPLCSNCHSIAHRRYPPYSVQEIIDMISRTNGEKHNHGQSS